MTGRIFHPVATDAARDIVLQHASPARVVLWGGWFCPFTHRTWAALQAKGIPISQRKGVLRYVE